MVIYQPSKHETWHIDFALNDKCHYMQHLTFSAMLQCCFVFYLLEASLKNISNLPTETTYFKFEIMDNFIPKL